MIEPIISIPNPQHNNKKSHCSKGSIHQKPSGGKFFVAWYCNSKQYKIYRNNGKLLESKEDAENLLIKMRKDDALGIFSIAKYLPANSLIPPSRESDKRQPSTSKAMMKNNDRRGYILHNIDRCYFCSSTDNVQLHHILPDENEHRIMWSHRWEKIRNEVEKCVPLCRSCHQKLHSMYNMRPISHGTTFAYEIYRCNCQECRAAHEEAIRESTKRRKNESQAACDERMKNIEAIAGKKIDEQERTRVRNENKAKKDLKNNLEYKRALMEANWEKINHIKATVNEKHNSFPIDSRKDKYA